MRQLVLTVLLGLVGLPAFAGPPAVSEDFSTTTFRDGALTTALWDTTTATLQLLPFTPSVLGSAGSAAPVYAVAVSGDVAYFASQPGQAFDITDPTNPTSLGTLPTIGDTRDIVVAGNHAFAADGASGFTVLDITNPAASSRLVTRATSGFASGVAVVANYAYVAMGSSGLQVIEITNRSNPTLRGSYNTSGDARKVAVAGDYAYVADGAGGLAIVDINNPNSPTLVSTFATGGTANDVVVDGVLAYVAAGSAGLVVVDVSDRASPALSGSASTQADALGIEAAGNTLLVGCGAAGVELFDVTDPTVPTAGATYDTPGSAEGGVLFGDYALLADGNSGMVVWRHAIRSAVPSTVASLPLSNSFAIKPLELDGDRLYVNSASRAYIYDVTDPMSPVQLGEYTSPVSGAVSSVAADGDLMAVYVTTGGGANAGVQLVDVSDPTTPTFLGLWFQTGLDSPLYFLGNHLYVLHDGTSDAVRVLDISNPASPSLVGSVFLGQKPNYLEVDGEYAYLGTSIGTSGATVFLDIDNPASPSQVNSTTIGPGSQSVLGDRLFVVDPPRLYTLDITNVPSFTNVSNLDFGEFTGQFSTRTDGDELFLASNTGMRVFDVSDPDTPVELGQDPDSRGRLELAGDLAFSVDGGTLRTIRIRSRDFDVSANTVTSLNVLTGTTSVVTARISTSQTPGVQWELSANGGGSWTTHLPGGDWLDFPGPGSDLRWRASLSQTQPGSSPEAYSLTIEYLTASPVITSVEDVGNDNGGQVRLRWTRSAYDRIFGSVVEYDLLREIPGSPGSYDFLRSLPAVTDETYAALVPTLADSTGPGSIPTTFVVRARTDAPLSYYDSLPVSGHSVDNLVPSVPQGLKGMPSGPGVVSLRWEPVPEPDVAGYRIYREGTDGFELVGTIDQPEWTASGAPPGTVRYRVTAFDRSGLESEPAEVTVHTEPAREIPSALRLGQSYPNPFNPRVTIPFALPDRQHVLVRVFDAAGREVARLEDGVRDAGFHVTEWDGRGRSSGVYFYRLEAGPQTLSGRMVLVK